MPPLLAQFESLRRSTLRRFSRTWVLVSAFILVATTLTVGVGVMPPFGRQTDWANPWIGRQASRDATIEVLSVEPALAWQSTSGVSAVGAGIEYRRGRVILSRNQLQANPFNGRI